MFTLAFVIAASVCSHAFSSVDTNLDLTKTDYIAGGVTAGGAAVIGGGAAAIIKNTPAAKLNRLNRIKALADDADMSKAQAKALGKDMGATEAQVESAYSIAADGGDTAVKAAFERRLKISFMVKFLEAQGVECSFILDESSRFITAYKNAKAKEAQDPDIDFKAEYTKELKILSKAKGFEELSDEFKLKAGKAEDELKNVFDDWVDNMNEDEFSKFQRSLKSGTLQKSFEEHLETIGGEGAGGGAPSGGYAPGPEDLDSGDESNDDDNVLESGEDLLD